MDNNGAAVNGRIRFSPRVELGHIMQAGVMLVAFAGWAIGGYQLIQKQLDQQAAEITLFKERLATYRIATDELRDNLRISVTETRQQLAKISDQIADLRTLVAAQGIRPDGRNAPRR